MRIRTDGKFSYREGPINTAADFYGCNKTKAVVSAAEDVPKMARAIRQVLARDDLTPKQKEEIADTLSTDALSFEVDETVTTSRTIDE